MTVKKECLVKSLKNDYSRIGLVTVIGAVIIGIILLFTTYYDQFYIVTQYFTAFNIYVVLASMCSVIVPVGLATDDYSGSVNRKGVNDKESIWITLLINFSFVFIPWFIYMVLATACKYPDVTVPTLLILAINTFIVTPLSLAYARCKE